LTFPSAYLLVSHGSRDPLGQFALERLAYLLRQQLQNHGEKIIALTSNHQPPPRHLVTASSSKGEACKRLDKTEQRTEIFVANHLTKSSALSDSEITLVGTASLECTTIPLHESLQQFAQQAQQLGYQCVKIIPLFLLPGVHVQEDLPREISIAQAALGYSLKLELLPYLGSHWGLIELLAQQFSRFQGCDRILLSHGSRRTGANQPVEVLAAQLGAIPAYWSVSPSLEAQVALLANSGAKRIAIVPYFLFRGGIAEAIAQHIQPLQAQFPSTSLYLGDPLGATEALTHLIVEGIV
jgi:sirohydrochlorin ferrochelatase